ncbi:hypothetical protein BDN72DRAFT_836556 [Pluteus cervinus]|uniref:Uncharacterized protein n=1 Tax=Pluteus cervinus TaxID=181527 RepID=A0ACD3B2A8_9AGAR|nr:hypothetical protein BDN72DRAFT_836556 [Pluteus cervinus]
MSHELHSLYMLARSKLDLSVSKDSNSLHRWVLLKNSIIQSTAAPPSATAKTVYTLDDDEDDAEPEADSFMFPDAGSVGHHTTANSEAEWLDSLLEGMGDDDEDEFGTDSEDVHVSALPAEDDDIFTPLSSPTSSSEDLPHHQPSYYPAPVVSYHVSLHSPLVSLSEFDSPFVAPSPYAAEVPLPYPDLDEVPEVIEDTSDDESDAPTTPSLGRSSSSTLLSLPPLSPQQPRQPSPIVYVEDKDSYFHRFDFDPLPFPIDHSNDSYNLRYQEC